MRLASPWWLIAMILIAPVLWQMEHRHRQWRARRRSRFADPKVHGHMFARHSSADGPQRLGLVLAVFCLLALAAARPQFGPSLRLQADNALTIYLLVDASSSMRCQDARPDRWRAATRLADGLMAAMPGDRFALIVFAGQARQACPATFDHETVANALHSIAPGTLLPGGSDPEAALLLAGGKIAASGRAGTAVVLISDGELLPPRPAQAVGEAAASLQVPVFPLGVGTPQGGPIPLGKDFWGQPQFRRYLDRQVVSRLEPDSLRRAAMASQGRYDAGTDEITLIRNLSARLRMLQAVTARQRAEFIWTDAYAVPAGLALLLIALGPWLAAVRPRRSAE